jgi:excinuclease UvrABC nuclease subunit
MNSSTLKENGFTEFLSLKNISFSNLPSNKSCVFAIINNAVSEKSTSDILYIGKAKKLTKRVLGGYIGGYGGKNIKKINAKLIDEGYIEKTSIGWILSDKPKELQEELLIKFKTEHSNYPLWNAAKKTFEIPEPKITAAKPKVKTTITRKARKT